MNGRVALFLLNVSICVHAVAKEDRYILQCESLKDTIPVLALGSRISKKSVFLCVCVCRNCVMLHNSILGDVAFVEKYTSMCYFLLVLCAVSKVRPADLRTAVTGTFVILLL